MLLVTELTAGSSGLHGSLEEARRLVPVVVHCEAFLVDLLLFPFVTLLLELLAQLGLGTVVSDITKVVVVCCLLSRLLLLNAETLEAALIVLIEEVSVLVRENALAVLTLEEAALGHLTQGIDNREVKLVADTLVLGNLNGLAVCLLGPVKVVLELLREHVAEAGQLNDEVAEGDGRVGHMASEAFLAVILSLSRELVLELEHLLVEDLQVDVAKQEL